VRLSVDLHEAQATGPGWFDPIVVAQGWDIDPDASCRIEDRRMIPNLMPYPVYFYLNHRVYLCSVCQSLKKSRIVVIKVV